MLRGNTFALRCHPFNLGKALLLLVCCLDLKIIIADCSVITSKRLCFLLQKQNAIFLCLHLLRLVLMNMKDLFNAEEIVPHDHLSFMPSTLFHNEFNKLCFFIALDQCLLELAGFFELPLR